MTRYGDARARRRYELAAGAMDPPGERRQFRSRRSRSSVLGSRFTSLGRSSVSDRAVVVARDDIKHFAHRKKRQCHNWPQGHHTALRAKRTVHPRELAGHRNTTFSRTFS
ncbi:hypothetical protein MRX96_015352 [Rhipicephalus microplus]